jgi:Rhodopirellula transposase DDE domain
LIDRIRKPGAGRRRKEVELTQLVAGFEKIITGHTAGCPVKGIRWTHLTIEEIREKLAHKSMSVCREVVYRLLGSFDLGRRQMFKNEIMKEVEGRDEQFLRIGNLRRYYLSRGYAVLSIDCKKKECLGPFYRAGKVYGDSPLRCYDHDFNSFSTGKIVPYGIYDLGQNEGHIFIGTSSDTSEFAVGCMRDWWRKTGCKRYNCANPILVICDGGGSNSCRSALFKEQLQILSTETELNIRVAHYPAYCSKYNPIEHRLFPSVTQAWSGLMLDSVDTAVRLVNERTANLKSGLRVTAKANRNTYETGRKAEEDFWYNCNISFDKVLPQWNYRIFPAG